MSDFIQTVNGFRYVEGWNGMCQQSPTKAATFQALVNLRMEGKNPTLQDILDRVRQDGLSHNGATQPINLSPTSTQTISRHLNGRRGLIAMGLVIHKAGQPGTGQRGRGGPRSPWSTILDYPIGH